MPERINARDDVLEDILIQSFFDHLSLNHLPVSCQFYLCPAAPCLLRSLPVVIGSAVECLNCKVVLWIPVQAVYGDGICIVDHVGVVELSGFYTIADDISVGAFDWLPYQRGIAAVFRVAYHRDLADSCKCGCFRVSEDPQ